MAHPDEPLPPPEPPAVPPGGPPPEPPAEPPSEPPRAARGWVGWAALTYVTLVLLNIGVVFTGFNRAYCGTVGPCVRPFWDVFVKAGLVLVALLPIILAVTAAILLARKRAGRNSGRWQGVLIGSIGVLITCAPCYPAIIGGSLG